MVFFFFFFDILVLIQVVRLNLIRLYWVARDANYNCTEKDKYFIKLENSCSRVKCIDKTP